MPPDPRPPKRIKNPALMAQLHREWRECAICGSTRDRRSLHHVHRHPRDDTRANLIMLCGDGTTLCHGKVTAEDETTLRALGHVILTTRRDTVAYLNGKLGRVRAHAWMALNLYAPV